MTEQAPGKRASRPCSVTLLALTVLILAGFFLLRTVQAVRDWQFLRTVMPVSPLYPALTGAVWALVALALAWGLWTGRDWAPRMVLLASLAYLVYYWLDRLLLGRSAASQTDRPFALLASLLIFGLVFWIVSRQGARAYFGRNKKRNSGETNGQ